MCLQLDVAASRITCCHSTGLLSVTFVIRHQFQVHCSLSLVLIHLTMANLLLSIHGFSTNDCRGSGPQRTCLSSSTLSRRLSFASIWGLHSYPSCGTPEVSIFDLLSENPAFDVFVDSHGGFEVDVESWFATFASTAPHLDEKVRSFITDTDPASH